jgi:hypothetical protein
MRNKDIHPEIRDEVIHAGDKGHFLGLARGRNARATRLEHPIPADFVVEPEPGEKA